MIYEIAWVIIAAVIIGSALGISAGVGVIVLAFIAWNEVNRYNDG